MSTLTTIEPQPTERPPELRASMDPSQDMDRQIALARAQELFMQACATRDAAYAHLMECPNDVDEAQAAVVLAQQTLRQIEQSRGRNNGINTNQLIATLDAQVTQARTHVSEHEAESTSTTKILMHGAEEARSERSRTAAKNTSATVAAARVQQQREAQRRAQAQREAAAREVQRRAHGVVELDEDEQNRDEAVSVARRAESTRHTQRFTRNDDDAPDAFRTSTSAPARIARRASVTARRTTYDVVASVGGLDPRGLQTAQNLVTGAVHARTDAERQYYEGEETDAIARRVAGRTFLGQEIDNALPQLANTATGRQISSGNWISGLSTSQVADRLRANGYIVGERSWNPFAHGANSQWSAVAVRRIDRNGDGQLTAAEIDYAMSHRYQGNASPNAAVAAAQAAVAQARINIARARADTNHDGRLTQEEINAAIRAAGRTFAQADADHNGAISNAELAALPAPRAAAAGPSQAQINAARARADTNHDGRLTPEEVNAAIRAAGRTFAQADRDHNGAISNAELASLSAPVAGRRPAPAAARRRPD